ncbi:MAG: hypothetical protein HYT71_03995 [Candidatus Aenigmarchaeota archaeon]|nr:hypothetical protein [Candidatus Aenigmarchaeota archaeon]
MKLNGVEISTDIGPLNLDPKTLEAVKNFNNAYNPPDPIKVYIKIGPVNRSVYEGRPVNTLTVSLTIPDHPELAGKATMFPYASESLAHYKNGSTPADKDLTVITRMEGSAAVAEIIEPAEQNMLPAHLSEIMDSMVQRRFRPVVGIAYARSDLQTRADWKKLYDINVSFEGDLYNAQTLATMIESDSVTPAGQSSS